MGPQRLKSCPGQRYMTVVRRSHEPRPRRLPESRDPRCRTARCQHTARARPERTCAGARELVAARRRRDHPVAGDVGERARHTHCISIMYSPGTPALEEQRMQSQKPTGHGSRRGITVVELLFVLATLSLLTAIP